MNYFLIDGYNLSFRCFWAMPDLTRSDGFPTGALHAFFASALRLSSMDVPHATAVFFDKGGSVRHRKICPEYKANRSEMPEKMRAQMPYIKRLCESLGFTVIEREGIEADDLLGSAAVKLKDSCEMVSIVSADKDFAQLVGPRVRQLLPPKPKTQDWIVLDAIGVKGKYGVYPNQIPSFLALIGDSADNISGLNGVGPKTAAKWLKDYGDLETIIRRYDWVRPEKFREVIKNGEALLRRNIELVTIDTACPLEDFAMEVKRPDFKDIAEFLETMQMKRSEALLHKFAKEQWQTDF